MNSITTVSNEEIQERVAEQLMHMLMVPKGTNRVQHLKEVVK